MVNVDNTDITNNMQDTTARFEHEISQMLYGTTVRVCCRRPHTVPQVFAMLDQDRTITEAVSGMNRISQGRIIDLEVPNLQLYNKLILAGIYCPTHKVKHRVVPVYTEDKCLITTYNTPTKQVALPALTKIIEDHGYTVQMVHQLELRPGLMSGIRKYLVSFKPYRTPTKLPAMVELYGRKIGFEQTPSTKIQDRLPPGQTKSTDERQDIQEDTQIMETETPQESTETLQESTETLQETTDIPQETTETLQESPELPNETHSEQPTGASAFQSISHVEESSDTSSIVDGRSFAGVVKSPITLSTTQPPSIQDRTVADEPTRFHEGISNLLTEQLNRIKSKSAIKLNNTRSNSAPYKIPSQETSR